VNNKIKMMVVKTINTTLSPIAYTLYLFVSKPILMQRVIQPRDDNPPPPPPCRWLSLL